MNFFSKAAKNGRTYVIAGAVLILLSLAGIAMHYWQNSKITPKVYTSISDQQNEYVSIDLIWVGDAFAVVDKQGNQNSDEDDLYYHFAQTPDLNLLVVGIDKDKEGEVIELWEKDPEMLSLDQKPLRWQGTISNAPEGMPELAKEEYALFKSDSTFGLKDADLVFHWVFLEGFKSESSFWLILGILFAVFGPIVLIIGLISVIRIAKARKEFRRVFPDSSVDDVVEQHAILSFERQDILLFEPFIFDKKTPFGMVDLRKVKQVAFHETVSQNVRKVVLHFLLQNNSGAVLTLRGQLPELQNEFSPLFQYLEQHYPHIQLGA